MRIGGLKGLSRLKGKCDYHFSTFLSKGNAGGNDSAAQKERKTCEYDSSNPCSETCICINICLIMDRDKWVINI